MRREGGCVCGAIRYVLTEEPFWTQACHCRDCQRITGGAFVVNMWCHESFFELTGSPRAFETVGGSGAAHDINFCPTCGTTLFSRYHAAPPGCLFVRAGTLDDTSVVEPKVHIHTSQKQPWVQLPESTPHFEGFYNLKEVWPDEARKRFRAALGG